jgi:uroporphyrinogen decarboxylase
LQHSCGKIFPIMDQWIAAGINAKHSNEDAIAQYDEWIARYGDRIGLFGGIDTDRLCRMQPDDVYAFVLQEGTRFRATAKGYALGSGNSIPDYVPVEGFLAMIRAAQEIRRCEALG